MAFMTFHNMVNHNILGLFPSCSEAGCKLQFPRGQTEFSVFVKRLQKFLYFDKIDEGGQERCLALQQREDDRQDLAGEDDAEREDPQDAQGQDEVRLERGDCALCLR